MVMSTAGSKEEADKLTKLLLEERLVSCVQQSAINSSYHWHGKIEQSSEILLMMKTKESLYKEVEETILRNHSYETPQIVCVPIKEGFLGYLNWIDEETKL